MKDNIEVKESFELPCSGCKRTAIFTAEGENPTFFHTLPYCDRFNEVNNVDELTKYMLECRDKAFFS